MLSIIICTYNRDNYLYNALKSIAENDFPFSDYEIVLINNNSTDATETECSRFQNDFPQVDFRYFVETNQGLSYARNRGIRESKGEILVFLDDDAFVGKNYLRNLQKNIETNPDWAAFGGKITPLFENGKTPEWLSKWTYSW
ncbi:MAG: glycosyltransferase family 2 protein, partial [Prevotellaceae bacterium]|nr:glycosyltransferase family 2 protein [Prevotellaceae bacterium]